ncbi:MAG: hypothetical protein SCALA702_07950 [Melioribacteraceae bacterium]|nr:MAG: hypothetical protein SCALA702_07950 [Melioribacteraceae bacterium]
MKRFTFVLILIMSVSLFAQFNGGTFNNVMNIGDRSTLELVPGTKMSKEDKMADDVVGDLFGSFGMNTKTNENPIIQMTSFSPNDKQVWKFHKVADNEFVIFNDNAKLALGIENASKDAGAKVIPMPYKENDQNQIFILDRDTLTHRYGSYWINKNSGLAVEYIKDKKEFVQNKRTEGNAYQVWQLTLRRRFQNKANERVLAIDKKSWVMPGAEIIHSSNAKATVAQWNMISLPGATGWYYIQNAMSGQFMQMKKNEDGTVPVGATIFQGKYNRDNIMVFGLHGSTDDNFGYRFKVNGNPSVYISVENNKVTTAANDTTSTGQMFKLANGVFSLF